MKRKGFTLIELMVVVLIVSILAAVAIPRYVSAADRAKWSEANASAGTIRTAIRAYVTEVGAVAAQGIVGSQLSETATQNALGFGAADLEATYFSSEDYTIVAIDATGAAEVEVAGGSRPKSPTGSYRLELDGDWVRQ